MPKAPAASFSTDCWLLTLLAANPGGSAPPPQLHQLGHLAQVESIIFVSRFIF
jgi:hypothetical protein